MVANKGIICTKIGCRFDEKHQMRQPLFSLLEHLVQRVVLEEFTLLDIAVNHLLGLVSGLLHDAESSDIVLGGAGGEAAAETVTGKFLGVESCLLHIFLYDVGNRFIREGAAAKLAVLGEAVKERSGFQSGGINPCLHCPYRADIRLGSKGDGDSGALTCLVALGSGDEYDESLGGEGQVLDGDSHQLGAAEGSGESKPEERSVPQVSQIVEAAETLRQQLYRFQQDWLLALLEGTLFPAYGAHSRRDEAGFGRIELPVVAGGDMIFADGGYPSSHGVGLGVVGQVVDVVDYRFRRGGENRRIL